jgi:hypothetical protein
VLSYTLSITQIFCKSSSLHVNGISC